MHLHMAICTLAYVVPPPPCIKLHVYGFYTGMYVYVCVTAASVRQVLSIVYRLHTYMHAHPHARGCTYNVTEAARCDGRPPESVCVCVWWYVRPHTPVVFCI
jgi:hypothetical protein